MRTSLDEYKNGVLFNGYDYTKQAWVKNGKYVRCNHPATMNCNCYGKLHAGEKLNNPNFNYGEFAIIKSKE